MKLCNVKKDRFIGEKWFFIFQILDFGGYKHKTIHARMMSFSNWK